jgi:hypothetical protein
MSDRFMPAASRAVVWLRSLAIAVAYAAATTTTATAQKPASRPAASRPAADAPTAVAELRALVAAGRFAEAHATVDAVRATLRGATGTDALRAEGARLIVAAGLPVVGAAAGFVGAVRALKDGVVEAAYDVAVAGWEADFAIEDALPTTRFAERDGATLRGTGALCHRALWTDDVAIEIEGVARGPRDFGPVLLDPDETGEARFLVGFHHNAYFGVKYDDARATTAGHVLLMAGRGAVSRAKTRPTQLFGAAKAPTIALGGAVRCALTLKGDRVDFATGADPKARASLSHALTSPAQRFARVRAGALVRDSALELVRVVVRGRLDPVWAAEETARLKAAAK